MPYANGQLDENSSDHWTSGPLLLLWAATGRTRIPGYESFP